ncbi:MAG: peptidase and in kexin sedolisin [Chthonomonadales bacterium]|nr:peptidase and in kexin sedolisin [Chthonomonadales bacterium]
MIPISLAALLLVFAHMVGRVKYLLGGKAPSLDCDTSQISEIDCSGFVRYAIAKATNQRLILPDGSAAQREWCERQGLRKVAYTNAATLADPSRIFICFITASHSGAIGHVWILIGGKTYESHGGGVGVSSRAWNTPVLIGNVSACYEMPAAA